MNLPNWDGISVCQMTKSVTCPEELGGLASQVTVDYGQLAHQGRLAAATAEPQEVSPSSLCRSVPVRVRVRVGAQMVHALHFSCAGQKYLLSFAFYTQRVNRINPFTNLARNTLM